MEFDIYALTPGGGGHVLTVHQERKDAGPRLVVIAGGEVSAPAEAMMQRMLGEPLEDGKLSGATLPGCSPK
ncbi:hypothetical protein ACFOHT_04955 [Massilia oculi]|uniref:Uncharacterized protein n=1 Tax=Massilia oculi TaxID=945844 RepID=A0A2S2DDJ8_9BURK|nr:hypothetical protein [Massilia oculi]AWL03417.1 hypothetical protein DIR46_02405 [Massilia oculi]